MGAPPDTSPSISTTDGRFNFPRLLLAKKSTVQLGCRLPGWGHKWFEICVLCRLCEVMRWVMRFIQDLATVQPWNKILM